jgi:hypothetical protein
VTLYRGCHGGEPEDLLAAMRSNYASGRRPHPADLRAAVLVMAVSMFEDAAFVRRVARARPESVGTHVAEVELRPGRGLCRADTGSAGHWSIWGVPERLVECIVDVVPEASDALGRLAEDPKAAESLLLVAFDDAGEAVADCVPGEPLVIPA